MRGGERGDLRVHVSVEVPSKLSAKQRELLEAFAREGGDAPRARKKGFVEKARQFFD